MKSMTINKKQSGMATLLIVIVIGMLLTVTLLGVVYSGRSTQEKQVAVHAVTHSQQGAWFAVDVFKQYLSTLTNDQKEALIAEGELEITAGNNFFQVTVLEINTAANNKIHAKARVTYKAVSAKSSSHLEVVFAYDAPEPPGLKEVTGIDVYGDLDIGGDITLSVPQGTSVLTVDGEVNFGGVNLSSLEKIIATKSIRTGSAVDLDELWSNEDIVLKGSARITTATAIGNIVVQEGSNGSVQDGHANGFIFYNSFKDTNSLNALGLDLNKNQILDKEVIVCLNDSNPCAEDQKVSNQQTNPYGVDESFVVISKGGANISAITAMGNSIHTGSVITQLGSGAFEEICYNDVDTQIDCTSDQVVKRGNGNKFGNVYLSDTDVNSKITAYGNVYAHTGRLNNISALGNVTASEVQTIGDVHSQGSVDIWVNGSAPLDTKIQAENGFINRGNLTNLNVLADNTINIEGSSWGVADQLVTSQNIDCQSTAIAFSVQYGTTISEECFELTKTKSSETNIVKPVTDKVEILKAKEPVEITQKPYVDMWLLEEQSHFAFRAEVSKKDSNRINRIVTVRDMMIAGTYYQEQEFYVYMKRAYEKKMEFLCTPAEFDDVTGSCSGENYTKRVLCITGSGEGCFRVNLDSDIPSWSVGFSGGESEEALVPGIYWFEGDLFVKTSRLNASLLATNNISTGGSSKIYAMNYSDFATVCENAQANLNDIFSLLDDSYPKTYCDFSTRQLNTKSVGNVVLGAGGQHPDYEHTAEDHTIMNTYKGGDIEIAGKTELWGTVLVGNEIFAGANVKIHGFFIALGWNDDPDYVSEFPNTLGGDLDIIYENVPDTYSKVIPSATNECFLDPTSGLCDYVPIGSDTEDKEKPEVEVLWTRYL